MQFLQPPVVDISFSCRSRWGWELQLPEEKQDEPNKIKQIKKQDRIKEHSITASYLPSDGDDQTLSCLQLQLGFIQQQTQHLQNLRVFRANIGKWHPVYIPCKCVQCRHSHSRESSDLWAKKREIKSHETVNGWIQTRCAGSISHLEFMTR